jgi:hypothetical protein
MKRIGYTQNARYSILMFVWLFLAWGLSASFSSVSAESVKETSTPVGKLDFDPVSSQAELFDGETMGLWQQTDFYGKGKVYAKDGAMVLERGNDMTGVTWGGPLVRINYEISLQAQRVEGSDFFCGLTFPVGDEYCSFICGGWGGSLVGLSCVDYYDAANNETSSGYDFVNKRWYSIRIRVTENMLQAWIDDDQVVDLDTADRKLSVRFEMEPSRPLGIATWQTAAAVRDISIRKVKPLPRYAEIYTYIPHEIEGWDVLLNEQLDTNHPYLTRDTLRLLKADLYRIGRTLSVAALTKLQRTKIWVELEDENYACMCYHPDEEWLNKEGYNPDKLNAIEIANAANFLKWTPDQPWMVLHELAHAYHHQVLGYDNEPIKAAFAAAKQGGKYRKVLHISGETRRHSALNSAQEYFAECTEAYFGTNDFYPFVRAELMLHDPGMYMLMKELWEPAD